MTEREYRQAEGLSKSALWEIRKSPAHYLYGLTHEREDTQALKIGRAIHAAILTPKAYKAEWAILPDGIDRRTKTGKEQYDSFIQQAEGREIISTQEAEMIKGIASAIRKHKAAANLLRGTKREKPIFWMDEQGIKCKCRVDAMRPGIMIDLKTTTDASSEAFVREALRYGYDVQAAHYMAGYQARHGGTTPSWYFIAIEKTEPFAVNVLEAGMDFIDHGIIRRRQLIETLKSCIASGEYPDYGNNMLVMPY